MSIAAVVAALSAIAGFSSVASAADSFPGQGFLPDGRVWEMVSPADKNGGDVMGVGMRTRAAVSGDAVQFASLAAFADVAGTGITAEYIAKRTGQPGTSGWATHGIHPKLDPGSLNIASSNMSSVYQDEFSDDLSKGVLRTFTNMSGDPNLSTVTNLYLRDDLLTPGGGSTELVTMCPACTSPLVFAAASPNSTVADATSDFGHIIFESRYPLLAEAPQSANCVNFGSGCQPRLYEWDHGTLRLAGVLPASDGGGFAPRSIAGVGAQLGRSASNAISEDGSKIFFTVPPNPSGGSGPVYMRSDQTTTVQINASERTDCAGDLTCGGDGIPNPAPDTTQPATYQTATPDGSKVFILTGEQLTDEQGSGIYVYDTTLPDDDPNNLTLLSVDEESADVGSLTGSFSGVFGTSDDGSFVYFTVANQLVAGEELLNGEDGLFLWHDGALAYVGELAETIDAGTGLANTTWITAPLSSRVSPDGRHLLFVSHRGEGLTGYDHGTSCKSGDNAGGCAELYLYSADAESVECVSCNPSGAAATDDSSFNLATGRGGGAVTSHLVHPLPDDGSRVFFTAGDDLVSEDRNSKRDVYMYDVESGELSLISSGESTDDSYFLDASESGDDVFFITRERLSGWDFDQGYDLYDARVGGGFPEPAASEENSCSGDDCQGGVSSRPALIAPRSAALGGAGDLVPGLRASLSLRRLSAAKLRRAARSGVLTLGVRTSKRSGRVRAVARARLGSSRKVVGRGTARIRGSGATTLRIRLTAGARRALGAGRTLRLVVTADTTGAGQRTTTVVLKRAGR
jgi:hypothetical protein